MSVKAFFLTVALLLSVCLKVFAGNKSAPLEILYIANVNALLENCHCGDPPLGGLARITTAVKRERQKNPALILIDGGDFFNSYPFEDLNKTVLKIYTLLNPDILSVGENEFIDGFSLIEPFLKINHNKILSTNYNIYKINGKDYIRKSDFVFLSYLDKKVFLSGGNDFINFNVTRFKTIYNRYKNRVLVVLYHGYFEDVKRFVALYPNIDLVLCAHSRAGLIDKYGAATIVGSGTDGEYIIKIFIDGAAGIKIERLPIGLEIKQDATVMKYVDSFKELQKNQRPKKN